jgi:hypothetical protein
MVTVDRDAVCFQAWIILGLGPGPTLPRDTLSLPRVVQALDGKLTDRMERMTEAPPIGPNNAGHRGTM